MSVLRPSQSEELLEEAMGLDWILIFEELRVV